MVAKEELVINTVHDKVNKDDIYLIWIMRNLLKAIDHYIFQNKYTHSRGKWFWMVILKKDEVSLFKESKFLNIFLNFHKNIRWKENWQILEYKLNDEYTLVVYFNLKSRTKVINIIIKNNIRILQSVFKDENLKVFQQKILDVFWLYWCSTIIQMLFYYLNILWDVFSDWSVKKNLWKLWYWDVTIDISILERIIQDWKEKFQKKLDLLYLLFSNINKRKLLYINFDHFFNFPCNCIRYLKNTNENIEQELDWELQTYSLKVQYLCSYIFKEFFENNVYWWPKNIFAFYDHASLSYAEPEYHELVWEAVQESYKNFDLKKLKRLLLIIDKRLCELYKTKD